MHRLSVVFHCCSVQITLQAVIDVVAKSHECHEADPHGWNGIRDAGKQLLTARELRRYKRLIPEDADLQRDWEAAVGDPVKYVRLMIGQKGDDEQREESDDENYWPPFEAEQDTQNYFLAYHQVVAHLRYLATRPGEAEVYRRFQVSPWKSLCVLLIGSVSLTSVYRRCGTVSGLTRAVPRVILLGMDVMDGPLSLSRSCRMLMRVVAKTAVLICSLFIELKWVNLCPGVSRRSSWVLSGWGSSIWVTVL